MSTEHPIDAQQGALFTDFVRAIMQQVYDAEDMRAPAVFEGYRLFVASRHGHMPGHAAAGRSRITLCRGRTYGTITPQVVTHRIAMRQSLLNVYIKMAYKRIWW